VYHVTSRGDRREPIDRDEVGRGVQLEILAQAMDPVDAQVLAYCLMGNHYHLVLHTRQFVAVDASPQRCLHAGLQPAAWAGEAFVPRSFQGDLGLPQGRPPEQDLILAKIANSDILLAMSTMNISLPDSLKAFIDARVKARGYGSHSEYL
jgi:hypothetical protein